MASTTTSAAPRGGARVRVQQFGTFLSNMVLPNIGAFIAWGLITALFIQTGWIALIGDKLFGFSTATHHYGFVSVLGAWTNPDGTPIHSSAGIVGPMITYLLPLLIGYTGGRMAYGEDNIRGGVVGAIATMGAVTGSTVPMFLGAMIMGPLGGWSMRKLDGLWAHKIRPGFEMLVNNFSAGIWGGVLAVLGFEVAGPFVDNFSKAAGHAVNWLVGHNLMPLASIFVEPAKVLFLNNAINHGVFTPLGLDAAAKNGHSLLFLVEANPGPGAGLLLAFMIFGRGTAKSTAPGALLIQFVGGIHEIYFPYVLMKPKLIIALILGGMTGVATNQALDTGLRSPASPGSIIAVWLAAPASSFIGVTLSVILAAAVSFAVASFLLKIEKGDAEGDLAAATASMEGMKGKRSVASSVLGGSRTGQIRSIVFACDAGMGSSAMGASVLRKKIQAAGHGEVTVVNKAISSLGDTYDLVVTHQDLTTRAEQRTPSAIHVSVDNFMASPRYDEIVELIDQSAHGTSGAGAADGAATAAAPAGATVLDPGSIQLHGSATSRDAAIDEAGRLLLQAGAVDDAYVASMHDREASVSTFMGNGLAIPHGTNEAKAGIRRTAMSFVRYDDPVDWNGKPAEFVIGIAGAGDDHLALLSRIAETFTDAARVARLRAATTPEEVLAVIEMVAV